MNDRERAIVMAYTGYAMLTGDKLGIYYEYVEEKLGRPIYTHELAIKEVVEEIKEKSKEDFIELCKNKGERKMKKILIFEDPGCCGRCMLCRGSGKEGYYCTVKLFDELYTENYYVTELGKVLKDCPLKSIPEKKEILCPTTDGIVTVTDVCEYTLNDYLFDKGYNACIDEITGEEE